MPRHKPVQNKPSTPRKQSAEFKYTRNFEHSHSVPCTNPRCPGFMFLLIAKYGIHTPATDELECFVCKRTRKMGPHDPKRAKPLPLVRKSDSKSRHRKNH